MTALLALDDELPGADLAGLGLREGAIAGLATRRAEELSAGRGVAFGRCDDV
jgi:hypothetical protein